jgi:hypothetical protein
MKSARKALFLSLSLGLTPAWGHAEDLPEGPGPVPFPEAPRSLSELPDFERKLALVRKAFWEFQDGMRPPADVGGEIFLEATPKQRPLKDGEPLLGCEAYLGKVKTAREAWREVEALSEEIHVRVEALRNETNPGLLTRGFEQIATRVDVAAAKAERISRDFPATLFSTPDRLIRYSWRVEPQDLFPVWEPGWRLESANFGADLLSLPGYTWAGQGLITDVAQVTRAPYTSGQSIVFERAASPASACAGPETIWLHGSARVTYKRPAQGNPGCPGGQLCSAVNLDPIVHTDVITVTLQGRPAVALPTIDPVVPPSKACPKPLLTNAKQPPDCPH